MKKEYPKTYEECCKVLDYCGDYFLTTYDNNGNPSVVFNILNSINTLTKLIICRNAYWKIADEEMGLGKPWKPDWNNHTQYKFGLYTCENEIRCINLQVLKNIILVFPTEEMRDAFYENFKELIESVKELL